MRRLLLAALLATPLTLGAQRPRNCNFAERAYDNPFSDHRGWTMRRYNWHAFYAGLGVTSAATLHRVGVPRWVAVAVVPVVRLALHVRGVQRGAYRIDVADFAFDSFVTTGIPAAYVVGVTEKSARMTAAAGALLITSYALLGCEAWP